MFPLILIAIGIGGLVYVIRKRGEGPAQADALDFASADIHTPPPETPPKQPAGQGPTGTTNPQPPGGQPTGQTVTTQPTATELAMTLPLVIPSSQPKMPSAANQAEARIVALQLEALLRTNPDGKEFRHPKDNPKNPTLTALLRRFQGLAGYTGDNIDGYYGPMTSGALMYYLGHAPPPPFVYVPGARVIKIYQPR